MFNSVVHLRPLSCPRDAAPDIALAHARGVADGKVLAASGLALSRAERGFLAGWRRGVTTVETARAAGMALGGKL